MSSLRQELAVATDLAREAGAVLACHQVLGDLEVRHKEGGEPFTVADLESDALIREGLKRYFPDDALYTEESADSRARLMSRRVWIVDPLDSTSSYLRQLDEYSLSIGLAIDGQPVLGVVCNPARDELVVGFIGGGVSLNGRPVRVSRARDMETARLSVSRKEWERGLGLPLDGLQVTPIGSMAYKLARVAAGLDDGVFSLKRRKEWGTCAGAALVQAAGGRITRLDGSDLTFNRAELPHPVGLIAAGAALYSLLYTWLAQTQEGTLV